MLKSLRLLHSHSSISCLVATSWACLSFVLLLLSDWRRNRVSLASIPAAVAGLAVWPISPRSYVSRQPMSIPSSRGKISRDSCLHDARNSLCSPGNVSEGHLARARSPPALENSKNVASSSCGSRPIGAGKIEGQRRSETGTARFQFLSCQEKERFVSYMRNLFSKHLRNQISELHFRKLPDSADFQFVKVNFKTQVCSYSGCLTIEISMAQRIAFGQISGRLARFHRFFNA